MARRSVRNVFSNDSQALLSCPFCGSEWHEDDDDGWIRIDHLKDCYLSAISSSTTWFIKQSMDNTWFAEHWNTRAERTCKMELVKSGPIYRVWRFSCCGYEHSENDTDGGATELPGTRCPKCGAVVNE